MSDAKSMSFSEKKKKKKKVDIELRDAHPQNKRKTTKILNFF